MQAVCARRRLRCRLHIKNEAAAVESSTEVLAGLQAAAAGAEPLLRRMLPQQAAKAAADAAAGTCAAAPAGSKDAACRAGSLEGSSSGSEGGEGAEPLRLVSGAGHDAMVFAEAGAPMGMLFVRCR